MSSRTITLSPEQGILLDEIVASGFYQDTQAALQAALEALRAETSSRVAASRDHVAERTTGLDGGSLADADDDDLDRFLDGWAGIRPPHA